MAMMLEVVFVLSALAGLGSAISDVLAAEFGYPAGVDVW
jgi:hypothetical protein